MDDEPVPSAALFGLLVTLTSLQLTAAAVVVRGHPLAQAACAAASVAAWVFLATAGRRAAAPYWRRGGRIVLTGGQTALVTLYIVATGCFGAWVFVLLTEG